MRRIPATRCEGCGHRPHLHTDFIQPDQSYCRIPGCSCENLLILPGPWIPPLDDTDTETEMENPS